MEHIYLLALALFFVAATGFLTAFKSAYCKKHFEDPNFEIICKRFFYRPLHLSLFSSLSYEGLTSAIICAQNISRFFYAFFTSLLLLNAGFTSTPLLLIFKLIIALLVFLVAAEYVPRIFGDRKPESVIRVLAFPVSFFLIAALPFTFLLIKLLQGSGYSLSLEEPLTQTKREIIEIIQRTRVRPNLNPHEKKLIEYVLRFKDRIAREVMVPRIDVFSLSADTPIKDAAKLVKEEGYSRVPIYKNSVDNICGVLMYKDILSEYQKFEESGNDLSILSAPIEKIQKGVLYTPETQKISNLLLEFRKKQVHLAIVVDEYGGTEGIVTIEDILEEIVGEIEDEYDEEEELFTPSGDGSWIVDARMGILDIEQQLGIAIPQEGGDYDTLGGYIFHCAGAIPPKGFLIHQEEFELEILSSDERRVEKVRIKPVTGKAPKYEENK